MQKWKRRAIGIKRLKRMGLSREAIAKKIQEFKALWNPAKEKVLEQVQPTISSVKEAVLEQGNVQIGLWVKWWTSFTRWLDVMWLKITRR